MKTEEYIAYLSKIDERGSFRRGILDNPELTSLSVGPHTIIFKKGDSVSIVSDGNIAIVSGDSLINTGFNIYDLPHHYIGGPLRDDDLPIINYRDNKQTASDNILFRCIEADLEDLSISVTDDNRLFAMWGEKYKVFLNEDKRILFVEEVETSRKIYGIIASFQDNVPHTQEYVRELIKKKIQEVKVKHNVSIPTSNQEVKRREIRIKKSDNASRKYAKQLRILDECVAQVNNEKILEKLQEEDNARKTINAAVPVISKEKALRANGLIK